MKSRIFTFFICLFLTTQAFSQTELISNGDFEAGNFGSWMVTNMMGGSGDFFISAPGANTPNSGFTTTGNPGGGSFYAVTDQFGPGTHALTQTFSVPAGTSQLDLSFDFFVNDQSQLGPIINPAGLDYTASPNQHARIDILTVTSGALSTAPADVVATYFIGTQPGALPRPYTNFSQDITADLVPGNDYIIRFAEVDNQGFFHLGVDNVSILATTSTAAAIPTMSEWGFFLLVLIVFTVGIVGVYNVKKRGSLRA